jgi:DNA polymerase
VKFAVPILYYGAHTGRFSGLDKINLQNLGRGSELRRALIAPEGYKIVAGDLAQIEARITACLARQKDLIKAFADGTDVYKMFAARLYNKGINYITKEERFVGKTAILGLGFAMGYNRYMDTTQQAGVHLTTKEAFSTVSTYRSTFSNIPKLWKRLADALVYMTTANIVDIGPVKITASTAISPNIVLPNGMSLHYPNLRQHEADGSWVYDHRGHEVHIFGGKLLENIVQALARIVLTTAELFLYKRGYLAALSVHDELVYVIPEEHADKFAVVLERTLTRKVKWMPELPLAAEVSIGDNYLEAK